MIYQISAGRGPAECELGVAKFLSYLSRNYPVKVLDTSPGYYAGTYRSVRLACEENLSMFAGSIQWICRSPYRIAHRRKNWFLDFSVCEATIAEDFDPEKVIFETFRSDGKGGQNVNKVESGVRAIYLPTGQAVVCTEERSQYANKQKALARLRGKIEEEAQRRKAEEKDAQRRRHRELERGNARWVFGGMAFRLD